MLLAVALVVSLLLLTDGDFQRTLDRVEHLFASIRSLVNQGRAAAVKTLETAAAEDTGSEQLSWDDLDKPPSDQEQPDKEETEQVETEPKPSRATVVDSRVKPNQHLHPTKRQRFNLVLSGKS